MMLLSFSLIVFKTVTTKLIYLVLTSVATLYCFYQKEVSIEKTLSFYDYSIAIVVWIYVFLLCSVLFKVYLHIGATSKQNTIGKPTLLLPSFFYMPIKANLKSKGSKQLTNKVADAAWTTNDYIARTNENLKEEETAYGLTKMSNPISNNLMGAALKARAFSKLIANNLEDKIDQKNKTYLDLVYQSSTDMYHLVDDLLAYYELEGKPLELQMVDCNVLVNEVVENYRDEVSLKNIAVTVTANLPLLQGDSTLLKQVFDNLINNAIKFADCKKKSYVSVLSSEEYDGWKFMIMDNGIGIPNTRTNIFEPSIRLNSKNKFKGNGMGLSFCRQIIQMHHGKITYQSEEGKGTIFMFILPKRVKNKNEIPQYVTENSFSR